MNLKALFPIADWLPKYQKKHLKGDITAGITVGIMLIPQGMAYAMLAGLPPIYGLYAAVVPQLIYALMGTSRQLAVGPVALDSLIVAVAIGGMAEAESASYIQLAILLALLVGLVQLSMGLLRLGFMVNFLSHPVISGFTSAAALIIALSQLKHLLGIEIEGSQYFHQILYRVVLHIKEVNLYSLGVGSVSIIIIVLINTYKKSIPAPFVVVVLGIFCSWYFVLYEEGLMIIREVPSSLPAFGIPNLNLHSVSTLSGAAFTLALIGFMEATAISKAIKKDHNDYEIQPNQELIALGLANIGGSFFKSFPVTGGFSRSAVNNQSGAKTNLAALISVLFVVATLLFLTPVFYFLPKTILASIIMVAVLKLVSFEDAKALWKGQQKRDFIILILTFLATLTTGIQIGIATGIVLSIIFNQWTNMHPECLTVHAKHDIPPSVQYLKFKNQLYFANSAYFEKKYTELIEAHQSASKTRLQHFILDGQYLTHIDSTGMKALERLKQDCAALNIHLHSINFDEKYLTNSCSNIEEALSKIQ